MKGSISGEDSDEDFTQRSREIFSARSCSVTSWTRSGKLKRAIVKKKHTGKKNLNTTKTAEENKKAKGNGAGPGSSTLVSTTWKEMMDRAIWRRDQKRKQCRSGTEHKNAGETDRDTSL